MSKKPTLDNAPHSVLWVFASQATGAPISIEMYELALKEGPEYFPEVIEYRRKWGLVPKGVKDAYFNEPLNSLYSFTDEDMPDALKNWPGILAATNEDWKIRSQYYNSDGYKTKWKKHAQKQADLYNKYFAQYGLTKTVDDYL